jgi:hypothetical protein
MLNLFFFISTTPFPIRIDLLYFFDPTMRGEMVGIGTTVNVRRAEDEGHVPAAF